MGKWFQDVGGDWMNITKNNVRNVRIVYKLLETLFIHFEIPFPFRHYQKIPPRWIFPNDLFITLFLLSENSSVQRFKASSNRALPMLTCFWIKLKFSHDLRIQFIFLNKTLYFTYFPKTKPRIFSRSQEELESSDSPWDLDGIKEEEFEKLVVYYVRDRSPSPDNSNKAVSSLPKNLVIKRSQQIHLKVSSHKKIKTKLVFNNLFNKSI